MKHAERYSNYKKALECREVILLTLAGSASLGLQSTGSDRDELGVVLETPADLVGFNLFETEVYRTAEDRTGKVGEPSAEGDIDLTLHGLRKYIKLALGGNPNLVNMLFSPKDQCIIRTPIGEELQALAPKLISKRSGRAFLGYMQAQKLRMMGKIGQQRVNRNELVDRYGYDVKYATHLIRLGKQGIELMETGAVKLPVSDEDKRSLERIRFGERSLDWVVDLANELETNLEHAMAVSHLRDEPDYDYVEQWMLNVYLNVWRPNVQATA